MMSYYGNFNLVVCFDAKIAFDDNALFKHPDILSMRDTAEEDPREVEAEDCGLNYVGMDGNIGCLGTIPFSVGTRNECYFAVILTNTLAYSN